MPSRSLFIPSCMTVQRQQQRQGKQPGGGGVGVRLGPGCREAVVVGTSSSLPLPFVPSPQNLSSEVPRRPPDPLPAPLCLKTSTAHDNYILFWPPSRRPQQRGDNTNFCIPLRPCARTTSSCPSTSTLAECGWRCTSTRGWPRPRGASCTTCRPRGWRCSGWVRTGSLGGDVST